MPKPRAYLIDASIYIFRAWYIYDENAISDAGGRPINAVIGFSHFLLELIRCKQPRHLACAFDHSQTNSYRRELFPAYKANREPAPEDLRHQFSLCQDFCRAIGIPAFGSDRFEADDIIGSMAAGLRRKGFAITVISADKDLAQLITGPEDYWWDFARGTVLDSAGIEKRFGVRPQQIADMLALSGDKIDNIPGIPGIGCKLASKLLRKYPCVESILENLDDISRMKFRGAARIQALLQAHRDMLPLNKKLTTIVTDMELEPGDIRWRGVDGEAFALLSDQLAVSEPFRRRWHSLTLPITRSSRS